MTITWFLLQRCVCVSVPVQLDSWCFLLESLPLIAGSAPDMALGLFLHTTLSSSHLLHAVTHSPKSQLHSPHTNKTPSLIHSLLTGIHKTLTSGADLPLPLSKKQVILTFLVRLYNTLTSERSGVVCFFGFLGESLKRGFDGSFLGQLAECVSYCEPSVVEKLISTHRQTDVSVLLRMMIMFTIASWMWEM